MGVAEDATASVGHAAGDVKDSAGSAPSAVRRRTRGNPVAAGLVAFGLGWLVASLIPASSREQQAAAAPKDAQPLTDEVTQAAKQVAGNLQEPAQEAVSQVKESASQSASTVKDEATSNAQSVSSSAQSAADEVKDHATT